MGWPDWRKPEKYPDPDLAPLDRWAWEFLRRNPEYQADYRQLEELGLHKAPATSEEGIEALMAHVERCKQGLPDIEGNLRFKWGLNKISSPEDDEAWKEWRVRPAYVSTYKPANLGRELRIVDRDGWRWRVKATEAHAELDGERWGFRAELKESELLVRIDVAGPIEDQLKTAEWLLKLYRDKLKIEPYAVRAWPELWPRYLRILDARSGSNPASWGEIAGQFTSESPEPGWDEGKAKDAYEAACRLRDQGWKFIASRHPDLEKGRARKRKSRSRK